MEYAEVAKDMKIEIDQAYVNVEDKKKKKTYDMIIYIYIHVYTCMYLNCCY